MQILKDRAELLGMLPAGGIGAELGVLNGQFSTQVFEIAKPRLLYLVDLWMEPYNFAKRSDVAWKFEDLNPLSSWLSVQQSFKQDILAGRVQLVCAEACNWLVSIRKSSLDWVYLDDDHSYGHVLAELQAALLCVKKGGWIMGHDYCEVLPGVIEAVDKFCRDQNLCVDVLTNEQPAPVFPRHPGMPEFCSYNSYAIQTR